jgi:hypothetical protein
VAPLLDPRKDLRGEEVLRPALGQLRRRRRSVLRMRDDGVVVLLDFDEERVAVRRQDMRPVDDRERAAGP